MNETIEGPTPREEHVVVASAPFGAGWGRPPFDAAVGYPERPGSPIGDNGLYGSVRALFRRLGLDGEHLGTSAWNPLRGLAPAGGRIVIKPNLVRHRHGNGGPLAAVVTDPRLLRAVLDYAVSAVGSSGEVIIADSPLQSCQFAALTAALGLSEMAEAAGRSGTRVRVLDYRREEVEKDRNGLIRRRIPLPGDPEGYVAVDLGAGSALAALFAEDERYRVTQYDRRITVRHHDRLRHEFLIPRSLLEADLVISLPKIKTHRKAGMTGALKNLVGINGSKAWLPHHRFGALSDGGDEYLHPSLRKRCMTRLWERMDRTPSLAARRFFDRLQGWLRESGRLLQFPDPYFEGSWWGNTTLPAMVTDLNRILVYAGRDGRLSAQPVRRCLVVADASLAGEGEGPLEPMPRPLGLILAARSPVAADWVAATLMGFDPWRIPTLTCPFTPDPHPLASFTPQQIRVLESEGGAVWTLPEVAARVEQPFRPPAGWAGRIEAARFPAQSGAARRAG